VTRIAIIDHGAGNLVSIDQGLRSAGADTHIASTPGEMSGADAVVLPGVGSTGAAMRRLRESDMVDTLRQWQGPLLGICVGLQLFFESSEEDDGATLDLLGGRVVRLPAERLPHMGWNDVSISPDPLFAGIADDTPFYFVHSFAPEPRDPGLVIGRTEYAGKEFASAVRSNNVVGVQFHPERSGRDGMQVLANFVRSIRRTERAA
jgi:glutamine amidotransferase